MKHALASLLGPVRRSPSSEFALTIRDQGARHLTLAERKAAAPYGSDSAEMTRSPKAERLVRVYRADRAGGGAEGGRSRRLTLKPYCGNPEPL